MSAPLPEVHTAPARSGRWWSSVPHHLGRARTSTVVLALLWVAIFLLYLAVRPEPAVTGAATTGNPNGGVQPAPTATAPRRTTAHPTTAPVTTSPSYTSPTGTATTIQTSSPTRTTTAPTTATTTPAGPALPTGGASPST